MPKDKIAMNIAISDLPGTDAIVVQPLLTVKTDRL